MADSAEDIYNKWCNSIPPKAAKSDVERVVEFYFVGCFAYKSGSGSHWLEVIDPELALIEAYGMSTGFTAGRFSLSLENGKTVKGWEIKKLVKAINLKIEWAELKSSQNK